MNKEAFCCSFANEDGQAWRTRPSNFCLDLGEPAGEPCNFWGEREVEKDCPHRGHTLCLFVTMKVTRQRALDDLDTCALINQSAGRKYESFTSRLSRSTCIQGTQLCAATRRSWRRVQQKRLCSARSRNTLRTQRACAGPFQANAHHIVSPIHLHHARSRRSRCPQDPPDAREHSCPFLSTHRALRV